MDKIQTVPEVFEIRDLRDVSNGPIFEAMVQIEQAEVLLEIIQTACEHLPESNDFNAEVLCCMLRRALCKTNELLDATCDYLYSHETANLDEQKESAPAATETQEKPKPSNLHNNPSTLDAALSNESEAKAIKTDLTRLPHELACIRELVLSDGTRVENATFELIAPVLSGDEISKAVGFDNEAWRAHYFKNRTTPTSGKGLNT